MRRGKENVTWLGDREVFLVFLDVGPLAEAMPWRVPISDLVFVVGIEWPGVECKGFTSVDIVSTIFIPHVPVN